MTQTRPTDRKFHNNSQTKTSSCLLFKAGRCQKNKFYANEPDKLLKTNNLHPQHNPAKTQQTPNNTRFYPPKTRLFPSKPKSHAPFRTPSNYFRSACVFRSGAEN
jgi:hypothetical protein